MQNGWKITVQLVFLWLMIIFTAFAQVSAIFVFTIMDADFIISVLDERQLWPEAVDVVKTRISNDLPHGRDGLPYYERALNADWAKSEFSAIYSRLVSYIRSPEPGRIPYISLSEIKLRLIETIDIGSQEEKNALADLWLSPLPDKVLWTDFQSISALNSIADTLSGFKNWLWNFGFTAFLMLLLIWWMEEWDFNSCVLFLGAFTLGQALLTLFLNVGILYISTHILWLKDIQAAFGSVGFSNQWLMNLLHGAAEKLFLRILLFAIVQILLSVFLLNISKTKHVDYLKIVK